MEPRVYRYRRAANFFFPLLLSLWALVWNFGLLVNGPHGAIKVNGRSGTPEQAAAFFWSGLAVGIPMACFAARLALGWLNERIEVREGTLAWFDWRNRERVRVDLGAVRAVRLGQNLFRRKGIALYLPQDWRSRSLSKP